MISCVIDIGAEIFMNIFEWVSLETGETNQSGWIQALDILTSMLFIGKTIKFNRFFFLN